jgi:hypothetical protein
VVWGRHSKESPTLGTRGKEDSGIIHILHILIPCTLYPSIYTILYPHLSIDIHMHIHMCIAYAFTLVHMHISISTHPHTRMHIHLHMYICIYIYVCVCVCMYMYIVFLVCTQTIVDQREQYKWCLGQANFRHPTLICSVYCIQKWSGAAARLQDAQIKCQEGRLMVGISMHIRTVPCRIVS